MNSQPEQLNEELERARRSTRQGRQPDHPPTSDPEVRELAALARSLQTAPALQVDQDFADRLERRVLARSATRRRQQPTQPWWNAFLPRPMLAHPARTAVLSLCLLVILLGSGVLVAAAFTSNPNNPLYAIKQLVQPAKTSPTVAPANQAEQALNAARSQLDSLAGYADAAHVQQYSQTLADFEQQLDKATQAINALPAGPDHTQLAGKLAALQADARHTLRGLLLHLALPERQSTTDELGRLGDTTVPQVTQVDLTLPAHPNGQATISISGQNLQAGAQLVVDGHLVPASGAPQSGGYLFTATWKGNQHPHTIGIMNPDGTVAQTTTIILHSASDNNGKGNGGNSSTHAAQPEPGAAPGRLQ